MKTILSNVTDSYLETALWSTTNCDENGDGDCFDADFDIADFTEEGRNSAEADCSILIELLMSADCSAHGEYANLFDAADDLQGYERIGHDFWLTRNGHGAGFWDGDYVSRTHNQDYGKMICELLYAKFGRYSEVYLYDNGEGCVDMHG